MASNFANQFDGYVNNHAPNPLSDLNNMSVSIRLHILLTYLAMKNVGEGERVRVGPATNDIRYYMIKCNNTMYIVICSPFIEGYYEADNEMLDLLILSLELTSAERQAYMESIII